MAKFKSIKTETFYIREELDSFIQELKDKGKSFNVYYEYDYNKDLYMWIVNYEV